MRMSPGASRRAERPITGHATRLLAAALLMSAAAPPKDPPGVVSLPESQQKAAAIHLALAQVRRITQPVQVPGQVQFDILHVAVVRPLAAGRVEKVFAQLGDSVARGQVLALMQSPTLMSAQADLRPADAVVAQCQAGVAVAEAAYGRAVILARDGALARSEAERRRIEVDKARADLAAARARLGATQALIGRLNPGVTPGLARLISPMAGIVASATLRDGSYAETGADGFTVADLSMVTVEADVPESQAALVAVGDPAHIALRAGSSTMIGLVIAVAPAVTASSRTLPVRIRLANQENKLKAGMAVEVTIAADRGRSGVTIPASAVQIVGDAQIAFTKRPDGKYQRHDLKLGVQRADWVEVRDGLRAGDEVVTDGAFTLKSLLQEDMLDAG